ncbi:rhamnogalacturonan lyase [Catalinimonas sp. 4WD22]|uniref:rhamnogalacturonan lyase n=1 Tax=Catalinimonas locisalis TaxID=3133978 RepID=UPI0031013E00
MHSRLLRLIFFTGFYFSVQMSFAQRQMEKLDRGIVAIPDDDRVFVSWRLLATDPEEISFNLYRQYAGQEAVKINQQPIVESTNFVDETAVDRQHPSYFVRPVLQDKEQRASENVALWKNDFWRLPLQTPQGYRPNDASVGDLDGDGAYEIVLHQVGRSKDNSQKGFTDEPILQAYEMDGTLLWSINLGKNIREGAHYTQFMVYDLDGDGKAEIACKTADGTTDGEDVVIGDPEADWRNEDGYILAGPEFLTVFDGQTGAALATTDYIPPRHPDTQNPTSEQLDEIWGDGYGNRMDRFLAAVAYLDGKTPSLIMARGYYTRAVIAAWNWRDGELRHVWTFDSDDGTPGNEAYRGEGNHNLSVSDVDGDGKDEIIYGAAAIDDDGTGLYATGLGHGDALHLSDLDPNHPGMEVFNIQERFDDAGANFRDADSGEILWKKPSVKAGEDGEGPGRANAINIDPRYEGNECWVAGANIEGLFSATGEKISDQKPAAVNFAVWWDGDLLREILDRNVISKWNWKTEKLDTIMVAEGTRSNNGTKATPTLSADLFGDWREEVILREENNQALRIYSSTIPTKHRLYTLMQNPQYRLSIAWQNVAYNQPPHTSFYIGESMDQPPLPDIVVGE